MSSGLITAEIFDIFLKYKSKAYFKSSGQIGEPEESCELATGGQRGCTPMGFSSGAIS